MITVRLLLISQLFDIVGKYYKIIFKWIINQNAMCLIAYRGICTHVSFQQRDIFAGDRQNTGASLLP